MTRSRAEGYRLAIKDLFGQASPTELRELEALGDRFGGQSVELEAAIRTAARSKSSHEEVGVETAAILCGMAPSTFNRIRRQRRKQAPLGGSRVEVQIKDIDHSGRTRVRTISREVFTLKSVRDWHEKVANLADLEQETDRDSDDPVVGASGKGALALMGKRRYLVKKDGVILIDADVHSMDPGFAAGLVAMGATIETIGFMAAMFQRLWADPSERKPWADALAARLSAADECNEKEAAATTRDEMEEAFPPAPPGRWTGPQI